MLNTVNGSSACVGRLGRVVGTYECSVSLIGVHGNITRDSRVSSSRESLTRRGLSFTDRCVASNGGLRRCLQPKHLVVISLQSRFVRGSRTLNLFIIVLGMFSDMVGISNQTFGGFVMFSRTRGCVGGERLINSVAATVERVHRGNISIVVTDRSPVDLPARVVRLDSVIIVREFDSPT